MPTPAAMTSPEAVGSQTGRLVVSPRLLGVSILTALILAGVFLAVVVWPAGHGLDPLGVGGALGTLREPATETTPQDFTRTLLVGENLTFEYPFDLPAGANVTLSWQSTSPITASLRFDPAPAEATGPSEWENQSAGHTFLTTAAPTRVSSVWHNPSAEPITITLLVEFNPPE